MKMILNSLFLVTVLCCQMSLTLYNSNNNNNNNNNHSQDKSDDNITAIEGQDVTFSCNIETSPGQQIVWRRGYEVLSAGPSLLKMDSRYSVTGRVQGNTEPGSQLLIHKVRQEDAGEFFCQVQTDRGLAETKQILTIQVPPRIVPVPFSGSVTARQGDSVSLHCNATGVPAPTLAWHKSVGTAPGGHVSCGGTCFTIPHVDLATSGDYICSAVNGVGHPQHATITLHVLYPPEVSCQSDSVSGGGGANLVLGCFVHGEPSPSVNWFKDGHMLETDGKRIRMEWNRDKRMHSLSILRSVEQDFGNYSCVASNMMGSSRCFMELNGRPFNVTISSNADHLSSATYYQVRWRTTSHFRVDTFTLLYRKISRLGRQEQGLTGEWSTVKIPGPGHHQIQLESSWTLTNLTSSSSYECIIQAHNQHGWSTPSPIYVFQTGDQDLSDKGVSSRHNWDKSLLVSGAEAEVGKRFVINCILLTTATYNFLLRTIVAN